MSEELENPVSVSALDDDAARGARSDHRVPRRQPRRLTALIAVVTLGVVAVDLITKIIAQRVLVEGAPTSWFLGELLGWKLIYNPGAALSIGTNMTWVLTLVALGVVVFIVRVARRIDSVGWSIAFALLLGGAIGNLIDRFLRDPGFARGHVVDFINYNGFFVGNVADIAIVVAAGLLAWLAIKGTPISDVDTPAGATVQAPAASPEPTHALGGTDGSNTPPGAETPGSELGS